MPNLTWTEAMEELLVDLVYSSRLHFVSNPKATKEIWIRVNKDIFMNPEFIPFKDEHYKPDDYRKIKDKYVSLKKEATKFMEAGNKSKGDGELSKKFATIHKIIEEEHTNEIERHAKKEAELAEKNLIQETGDRIVSQRVSKRDIGKVVHHLDGTVSDNRIPKKGPRFEDVLYQKMAPTVENFNEKATEEKLIAWVDSQGLNVEHLFTELNIHKLPDSCSFKSKIDESMDILRAIGLKNIINVFCQNGKKFSADYFRERLTAVSVHEFLTMMIFPILESWRKDSAGSTNTTTNSSISDIEIVDESFL